MAHECVLFYYNYYYCYFYYNYVLQMLLQKIVQEPRPMLSSPEHIYVRRLQTCYVNNLKFRELHSSFGLWGFSKRCYMQKKMVTRSSNNSSLGRGLYYLSIGKNWVPVKGVPFISREALYVDTHTHTHTHTSFPSRPAPIRDLLSDRSACYLWKCGGKEDYICLQWGTGKQNAEFTS